MKIPINILNIIVEKRNQQFKTNIDDNDIFNEKNISSEAIDLLCWLEYNFWSDSIEKERNNAIIKRENEINNEIKMKKYNPDNLFKNTIKFQQEETSMIEYKESNFLQKLLNKIKNLFRKN